MSSLRQKSIDSDSLSNSLLKFKTNLIESCITQLLTETNLLIINPSFLHHISSVFIVLQIIFGGFFLHSKNFTFPDWFEFILQVVFIGFSEKKYNRSLHWVLFILDLFSFLLIIVILFDYILTRHIRKFFLKLLRYWNCELLNMLIIPNVLQSVSAFTHYGTDPNLFTLTWFSVHILCLIFTIVNTFMISVILEDNPYLHSSVIFVWRVNPIFKMMILFSIPVSILVFYENLFDEIWGKYLPGIIMIILSPFIFIMFLSKPFKSTFLNALYISIPVFMISSSILFMMNDQIPFYVYIIIPLVCFMIAHIIDFIILKRKELKIENSLNCNNVSNLEISQINAAWYLQIGLQKKCKSFLNWQLSNELLVRYPNNNELILFISHLAAFFPSERRFFSSCLEIASQLKLSSFKQRCFILQLQRIHTFRETHLSNKSNDDYNRVSKITDLVSTYPYSFWRAACREKSEIDVGIFTSLSIEFQKAEAIWSEALVKYPNNPQFKSEYARFLLDGESKYHEALIVHQNSLNIKHSIDQFFICFLQEFPDYLKEGYVDYKGKLYSQKNCSDGTNSLNDFNQIPKDDIDEDMSTGTNTKTFILTSYNSKKNNSSDSSLEIDEKMAEDYLTMHKLRISLQRNVENSKLKVIRNMTCFSIARLVLITLLLTVIFILTTLNSDNEVLFEELLLYEEVTSGIEGLMNEITFLFISSFQSYSSILENELYDKTRKLLSQFDNFMISLYKNVETEEVKLFNYLYDKEVVDSSQCTRNNVTNFHTTRSALYKFYMQNALEMSMNSDYQLWMSSDNMCQIIYINTDLVHLLHELLIQVTPSTKKIDVLSIDSTSLENEETDDSDSGSSFDKYDFIISFAPFFIFFISLPSFIYSATMLKHERKRMLDILLSVSTSGMENASNPILGCSSNNTNHIKSTSNPNTWWIWTFLVAIVLCAFIIMLACLYRNFKHTQTIMINHISWTTLQRNIHLNLANNAIFYIFSQDLSRYGFTLNTGEYISSSKYLDIKHLEIQLDYEIDYVEQLKELLYYGSNEYNVPSVLNYNHLVEVEKKKSHCETLTSFTSCIAFSRITEYLTNLAKEVRNGIENINLDSPIVDDIIEIANHRLQSGFDMVFDAYRDSFSSNLSMELTINSVFFVICLVLTAFSFWVELYLIIKFSREFFVFKVLLLRLSPLYFVSNHSLLSLIHKTGNDKKIVSSSHAMFIASADAMMFLNNELIIENVNSAVTNVFGFSPEQLLGQDVSLFLASNSCQKVNYMKDLMHSGEASLVFETEALGKKDDGTDVPLHLTLIGLTSDSKNKSASHYAILMKDMTEEHKQMVAVQEAKKQAEIILLQILPKDIIRRLNQGDKDITFTVNSSTIIFIDIEKFSIYSETLNAKDILLNLSKIFTAYDRICSTFPLITKIKLIGDDYMAAAGLFNQDVNPQQHALQMVQFGLQCLSALEEINQQLDSNLQARVGVNTDGPLIAGVLGTDKPMFDIIGDPINVAARLQSTDIPGLVQISEGTYDLVAGLNFRIEERGMIELKGKGKRKTFLVYPEENTHSSSITKSNNINVSNEEIDFGSSVLLKKLITKDSSSIMMIPPV